MTRLSRSDLEAVLDFAGEVAIAAGEPGRQDERLLSHIARLVESDMVKYSRVDASHRPRDVTVLGESEPPPTDELLEVLSSEENPYNSYAARTREPHFSATRLFDIVERGAFRRTKLYQLIPFPEAPSVQMRMPGHDGSLWKLEVLQPNREFTDRQLSLLDAVRPWLELYEERQVFATHVAAIGAPPVDQDDAVRLSEREHQVLDRLAEGASNRDIAEALYISPGTVRKHLENIYSKLGVTSRTAALARTGRTTARSDDGANARASR